MKKLAPKLHTKVIRLIVVLMGVLVVLFSVLIMQRSAKDLEREIGVSLANTAFQMTSRLDQFMWGRAREVRVLVNSDVLRQPSSRAEKEELLNWFHDHLTTFSWIGVTDLEGLVITATDGILVGTNIANRPVYQQGIKGEFIGDVHEAILLSSLLPNPTGEKMKFVDISYPLYDKEGRKIGVLAAHLSWSWASQLEQAMFSDLNQQKQEEIFIVSSIDNVVLLGPVPNWHGQTLQLGSVKQAQAGKSGWMQEAWPDGKQYLTGYAQGLGYLEFPGLGWTVLVRKPLDVAQAPIVNLQFYILLLGVFLAALVSIVGWRMTHTITEPIKELAKLADRIRFGGKIEPQAYKGVYEIEILSESLRHLAQSLTRTEGELDICMLNVARDNLTGLYNRAGLDKFVESACSEAEQKVQEGIVILYMDLDGFKAVNDTYGHGQGDQVLIEVANRLRSCIRKHEFAARLGGDEFIVMIRAEPAHWQETAQVLARRIIAEINQPMTDKQVQVGCSIGCAFWQNGLSLQQAIQHADEMMYKAKANGKNQFYLFEG